MAEAALELGLAEADAGQFDAAVRCLERAERLAPRGATLRRGAGGSARRVPDGGAAGRGCRRSPKPTAPGQGGRAGNPRSCACVPTSSGRATRAFRRFRRSRECVAAVTRRRAVARLRVAEVNGLPATAGQLATDRIAVLLRKTALPLPRGREAGESGFDAAPTGKDRAAALERLTVDFPNAAARRVALRELIALYSQSGRPAALGHTYGRLIADPGPEDDLEKLRSDLFLAAVRYPLARSTFPVRLPLFRSWETSLDSCEAVLVGAVGLTTKPSTFCSAL